MADANLRINITVDIPPDRTDLFNYFDDVSVTISGMKYTITDLLHMSDTEFSEIYKLYQKHVSYLLTNLPKNGTIFIGIAKVIENMERVRLERRIIHLEKLVDTA